MFQVEDSTFNCCGRTILIGKSYGLKDGIKSQFGSAEPLCHHRPIYLSFTGKSSNKCSDSN